MTHIPCSLAQDISAYNVTAILVTFLTPLPESLSLYTNDMVLLGTCLLSSSSSLCTVTEVLPRVT